MHEGHVIALEEVVDVHLPVASDLVVHPPGELEPVDLRRCDPFDDPLERLGHRARVGAEVHEDLPLPEVDLDGDEPEILLIEELAPVHLGDATEGTVEQIGPPVILAAERLGLTVAERQGAAPVLAHIIEGAKLPLLPPHHDHRIICHGPDDELSGLAHLVGRTDVLPALGKDRIPIHLMKGGIGVPARRDRVRSGDRYDLEVGGTERWESGGTLHGGKVRW